MTVHGLPMFEGHQPTGLTLSLVASIVKESAQPAEPLDVGEEVVLVTFARVVAVVHRNKRVKHTEFVVRHRTLQISEAFVLDGIDGIEILREARAHNAADAEEARAEGTGQDRLLEDEPDPPAKEPKAPKKGRGE